MKIVDRMPLYVGKKCNAACLFCYYISEIGSENLSFESIVNSLEKYKINGIKSIDITGGEPTIHKDIVKIVKTAVLMGFKDISIITNGIALKNEEFVQSLADAGISTFIISIHGPNSEIHDKLTRRKGSFDAQMKAISYFIRNNIRFYVNTVVNIHNYSHLTEFADLLCSLNVNIDEVTFLILNPMNDAKNKFNELSPRYSDIKDHLESAVNILKGKGFHPTWKFMPLCQAPGILGQTANVYQFFFKPHDWNYNVQVLLDSGRKKYLSLLYKNFSRFDHVQLIRVPHKLLVYMAVLKQLIDYFLYIKIEKCKICRYFYVCDGVSSNYIELYGDGEINPAPGKMILNPADIVMKSQKATIIDIARNYILYIY
ncbi:MAG: radical SAM protein, partial [Brevinematales bacterium]